MSLIKLKSGLKSIIFFVSKDILIPLADRLALLSSKETSSDILAIWKFSCNSSFKVSSNNPIYLSSPFVKLKVKEVKYFFKKLATR